MAYLYASSKTWRRIVDATSRSSGYMLAFAGGCVALPYFLGDQARGQALRQSLHLHLLPHVGAVLCQRLLLLLLRLRLPACLPIRLPACLPCLQVMQQTNAAASRQESELERKLRSGAGLDAQMLARAQRERLQVLLNESKSSNSGSGSGEARYRAALDGQSLGTHSSGSTVGAVAIKAAPAAGASAGKETQKGKAS